MSQSTRTDYSKRLTDLHQCLNTLHKQSSIQELTQTVIAFLKESFGFSCVWIGQYIPEQNTLSGLGGHLGKGEGSVLQRSWKILPGDLFDQVIFTGKGVDTPNLQEETRIGDWQGIARKFNIQGALLLPIRHRHQSIGVILAGSELWGNYPRPEEVTELEIVASTLGAALSLLSHPATELPSCPDNMPLWQSLYQLMSSSSFDGRVEKALAIAYDELKPTKVSFYRFDMVQRSCYLQILYTERQGKRGYTKPQTRLELPIQEIAPFYQYLTHHSLLSVADIHKVTDSQNAPIRLMGLAKAKSLLSVGIYQNQQLLGFLALEEQDPRIWDDAEKHILKTLGQFLSHSSALDECPQEQPKLEGYLEVLQNPVCDPKQWSSTLHQALEAICLDYDAQWSAIFDYLPEQRRFTCIAKGQVTRRKTSFPDILPTLSDIDFSLLDRSVIPIQINLAAQDLKFLHWHPPLLEVGLQSFIILKLNHKRGVSSVLMLGTDRAYKWMEHDCQSLSQIAKTLGHALQEHRQWQHTTTQHRLLLELIQGFSTIQRSSSPPQRCSAVGEMLQTFLNVDAITILQWTPNQPLASIGYYSQVSSISVSPKAKIDWKHDPLLRQILKIPTVGTANFQLQPFTWTESLIATQPDPWLFGTGSVEGYAIPLRCPTSLETFGIVMLFTTNDRHWSPLEQEGSALVATSLTELCRTDYIQSILIQKQERLECLNWYKQRQIEHLSQTWQSQTTQLQSWLTSKEDNPSGLRSRKIQPIEILSQSFQSIDTSLKQEIWQMSMESEVLPLATLLRRSLARVEPVVQKRQLWTQVHNAPPNIMLQTPGLKLELILTELLLAACYRTKINSRVDVWCNLPMPDWVDITITDTGRLNPQLVHDIQEQSYRSPLHPSAADSLPGLHFKICQILIHQLRGQFEMGHLEDGRAFSRVLLKVHSA